MVDRYRRVPQPQRGGDPDGAAAAVPGGQPALGPEPGERSGDGSAAHAKLRGQLALRGEPVRAPDLSVQDRVADARRQRRTERRRQRAPVSTNHWSIIPELDQDRGPAGAYGRGMINGHTSIVHHIRGVAGPVQWISC